MPLGGAGLASAIGYGITGGMAAGAAEQLTFNLLSPCAVWHENLLQSMLVGGAAGGVFGGVGYGIKGLLGKTILQRSSKGMAALDEMYIKSRQGSRIDIREVPGADAREWFNRIVDPHSVRPHPDPKLANQGGLQGKILRTDTGRIFYRPSSLSGNPALDISNAPSYIEYLKFHFPPQ